MESPARGRRSTRPLLSNSRSGSSTARGCSSQLRKAQLASLCLQFRRDLVQWWPQRFRAGRRRHGRGRAVWWQRHRWRIEYVLLGVAWDGEDGGRRSGARDPGACIRGSGDGGTDDPRRLSGSVGRVVSASVVGEPRRRRFGTDWKRGLRGVALHRRLHHDAWPLHRRLHRGERPLGVAAVACRERKPVGRQQRTLVHWCGRQRPVAHRPGTCRRRVSRRIPRGTAKEHHRAVLLARVSRFVAGRRLPEAWRARSCQPNQWGHRARYSRSTTPRPGSR